MARDPQQLRKAYEYKLGKELTAKLSDAQISELSKYYNSLPPDQQSDVDSELAIGKGEFLDTARSFAKESQKEKAKVAGQKIRQKAEADVGDFAQQERDLDALNNTAAEKKIPKGIDSLLKEIRAEIGPKKGKKSSALTVIPKRVDQAEEKLIDEDIDPKILELLGIDDPTGLDYSDYKSLLKEKMAAARMTGDTNISTGDNELLNNEYKRIKKKSGKFTVKNQKIKAATFVAKKKEPSSSAMVVTPISLLPKEADKDIKPEKQSVDKTFALIASKLNSVDNNVRQITKNIEKKDAIEKKQDDRERIDKEIAGNQERENITERKNLLVGAVSNIKKSLKPVTSMVSGFFDFFKRLGFAIFIMELMKFLENPAKYINGISKFINKQIKKLEKSIENFIIDKIITPLNGQIRGLNTKIQNFVIGINRQLQQLQNIPFIGNSIQPITVDPIPLISPSIIQNKVHLGRVPLVPNNFLGGVLGGLQTPASTPGSTQHQPQSPGSTQHQPQSPNSTQHQPQSPNSTQHQPQSPNSTQHQPSTNPKAPDPGTTTPIGVGSKGNQSQRQVAAIMYKELIRLGYSDIGAKLMIAEMGRENSLNIKIINGTHMDGPNKAWGAVSWQKGREKILKEELRRMGIPPTEAGLAASGDKGIIANVRAFHREMGNRGVGNKPDQVAQRQLSDLLRKPNLTDSEREEVRQLFKDVYFVYGASNGITRSREWLKNVNTMLQKIGVGPLSIQPSSNPNLLTTQLLKPVPSVAQSLQPVTPTTVIGGGGGGILNAKPSLPLSSAGDSQSTIDAISAFDPTNWAQRFGIITTLGIV